MNLKKRRQLYREEQFQKHRHCGRSTCGGLCRCRTRRTGAGTSISSATPSPTGCGSKCTPSSTTSAGNRSSIPHAPRHPRARCVHRPSAQPGTNLSDKGTELTLMTIPLGASGRFHDECVNEVQSSTLHEHQAWRFAEELTNISRWRSICDCATHFVSCRPDHC
jgi:hypothetical protein